SSLETARWSSHSNRADFMFRSLRIAYNSEDPYVFLGSAITLFLFGIIRGIHHMMIYFSGSYSCDSGMNRADKSGSGMSLSNGYMGRSMRLYGNPGKFWSTPPGVSAMTQPPRMS